MDETGPKEQRAFASHEIRLGSSESPPSPFPSPTEGRGDALSTAAAELPLPLRERAGVRGTRTVQPDLGSVLAVIPCLNEAAHIEAIARAILAEVDRVPLTLVIADGSSTDGTRELAQSLANRDSRVLFLDNPKRIQSAAVNLAVQQFGAGRDFLLRIDAHAAYPRRFCETLLREQAATGADSVVVSMIAKGETCFQRAAAAAQNSVLGNGGSAHRRTGEGRFTDHGHHALMRLSAYRAAGGYDETFTHNEDAELDFRLRSLGYRIWLSGMPPIIYFPRRTPMALFRQYFNYGKGRARTLFKHRTRPKLRQSAPLAVAPAVLLGLLAPLHPVFALPAAAWAGLCAAYGIGLGIKQKDASAMLSGFAAMIMHLAWSAGFLLTAGMLFRRKAAVAAAHRKAPAPAAIDLMIRNPVDRVTGRGKGPLTPVPSPARGEGDACTDPLPSRERLAAKRPGEGAFVNHSTGFGMES